MRPAIAVIAVLAAVLLTGNARAQGSVQQAAQAGDPAAEFARGLAYRHGRGVSRDYAKAAAWFRKAAVQGYAPAEYRLGVAYYFGQGLPQDYAKGMEWYRKAAAQGNAGAEYFLGIAYSVGQGVPQDYAKAVEWYRKAAAQGDAVAEDSLGAAYYFGRGVPQNYAKAVEWVRKAAVQGNAGAESMLGEAYGLGQGVPRDYGKAVEWYRKAAAQGYAVAEIDLGRAYYFGLGVPRDYAKAAEWERKAAAQGHDVAETMLGFAYASGRSVPQDYVRAYKWFNLAAAQGNTTAAHARSLLSSRMTPEQIADAQRLSAAFRPQVTGAPPAPAAPRVAEHRTGDLGSGFFVTARGLAVTNAHVVNNCQQVRVGASGRVGTARLLASDPANDLALLATGVRPGAVAALRLTARQGDAVAVYGFPLPGLLATGGNVTFGNITALTGPADDSGLLQISAPVQPGNSGGPVLDDDGNVVGVVVAKLNALRVAAVTADIPQNVNFAIKASVLADFLAAHGITFTPGTLTKPLPQPAIAMAAKNITIAVECDK